MKRKTLTIVATASAAASIFFALAFNGSQIKASQENHMAMMKRSHVQAPAPEVEVLEVSNSRYQAVITGYGVASPQFELDLVAEVSGHVQALAPAFKTGAILSKGQLIAQINPVEYQQDVASAEVEVAEAEQALLEEQREGKQARLEWQRSGMSGQPDSPLVLREPQLKAAQNTLKYAQKQLAKAQYDLEQTAIRAPFDAVVVTRDVQPGSYLETSSAIATLYSTDKMEITVPLSDQQWQNLPALRSTLGEPAAVTLVSSNGLHQWQGYVDRTELHLDDDSRQRSLVVVVEKPLEQPVPLLAGEFVTAKIQGRSVDQLWQVPASAISQAGEIWYVEKDQYIRNIAVNQLFAEGESVYIEPVESLSKAQIVVRPLVSYVSGMQIKPMTQTMLTQQLTQPAATPAQQRHRQGDMPPPPKQQQGEQL